jgi:stromal membrane-associated protein
MAASPIALGALGSALEDAPPALASEEVLAIEAILARPENRECADCGAAKPTWAAQIKPPGAWALPAVARPTAAAAAGEVADADATAAAAEAALRTAVVVREPEEQEDGGGVVVTAPSAALSRSAARRKFQHRFSAVALDIGGGGGGGGGSSGGSGGDGSGEGSDGSVGGGGDHDVDEGMLGAFVCLACAGVHRSLGVHISFVQSATIDEASWTPAKRALFGRWGNARANALLEYHVPPSFCHPAGTRPGPASARAERERFTRAKYEERRFVAARAPLGPSGAPIRLPPATPERPNPRVNPKYKAAASSVDGDSATAQTTDAAAANEAQHAQGAKAMVGLLAVQMINGRRLAAKDIGGTSDPYVMLMLLARYLLLLSCDSTDSLPSDIFPSHFFYLL